jgi:tRNA pseudouridine38-40 synthase
MSQISSDCTFLLFIEYNGTGFSGWQVQPGFRTVQAELEAALKKLFKKPVTVSVTGRTDAGVHAQMQAASFTTSTCIPALNIQQALNGVLPQDISIKSVRRVKNGFNARYDATKKVYQYHIWNRPYRSVWQGANAWHVWQPLNVPLMRKAAKTLCGKHDFSSFDAKNSVIRDKVATILSIKISSVAGKVTITFTGERFLYKMVRNMVGTLVDVGLGKTDPAKIAAILGSKRRSLAGPTAPANGLFLKGISFKL